MRKIRFWPTLIKVIMITLIILVVYVVYYSIQEKGDEHEQSMVGRFHNIGDALGGMTAPLVGLISALLVYLSFQAQIEANRLTSEIRNDEILKENLNDFLNRIKDKFKSITQSIGGEKRFDELFLSLGGHYNKLTDKGKARLETTTPFDLQSEAPTVLIDVKDLQDHCAFFSNYILRVGKRNSLTIENRELISIYISEYVYFLEKKLDSVMIIRSLVFDENEKDFLNIVVDGVARNLRYLADRKMSLEELDNLYIKSDRGRESKWKHVLNILFNDKESSLKTKWNSIKHLLFKWY